MPRKRVPYRDLTGQRFGRLVVLRRAANTRWGAAQWECQCDCGNIAPSVRTGHLASGDTRSCGCLQPRVNVSENGGVPLPFQYSEVLSNYKIGARRRGMEWSLTAKDAVGLLRNNCHYCGCPPRRTAKKIRTPYNGIDRMDPSLGYTPDNCISCCWTCNNMKSAMTYKGFVDHITAICKNLSKANK